MSTVLGSPRVSGRRAIRSGSAPAMHAAVPRASAAAAPQVTYAASAPSRLAITAPERSRSCCMSTYEPSASRMARRTRAEGVEPPSTVLLPRALISGVTPSCSYTPVVAEVAMLLLYGGHCVIGRQLCHPDCLSLAS